MKAILVAFLLFASIIFIPTSTLARVMKEEKDQGLIPTYPNKPFCKSNKGYTSCVAKPAPTPTPKPCSDPYKGGYRGCIIPPKPVPTPTPKPCSNPNNRACHNLQKPAPPPPCSNSYKRNC